MDQAIADKMQPGDAVYSLQRKKLRPWWLAFLDEMVTGGVIRDTKDLHRNIKTPYYLIANAERGLIVRVVDGRAVEEASVPDWTPDMAENFRVAKVNGYRYRRVVRL
jgi:hypothetical protein